MVKFINCNLVYDPICNFQCLLEKVLYFELQTLIKITYIAILKAKFEISLISFYKKLYSCNLP